MLFRHVIIRALPHPILNENGVYLFSYSYISHIRLVHWKDAGFELQCGIGGCTALFRTFGAFNSHVYRHHRDAMELTVLPDVNTSSSPTIDSTVDISLGDSITEESTGNLTFVIQNGAGYPTSLTAVTRIQQLAYMDSQTQKESAKFLMKLSQCHHLSQMLYLM